MKTHLYTVSWNDLPMLDFFFRHYEPFVDHFFIYDDNSTDGTRGYLQHKTNVTLYNHRHRYSDSWVKSAQYLYNTIWKSPWHNPDWVIITNIDEHLYHADIFAYLQSAKKKGITAIPALGFQMITKSFPKPGATLCREHTIGAPWDNMSKLSIFNPREITNSNYSVGRHTAKLEGNVVYPERDELLNLHYKYLGLEETHQRHTSQALRLHSTDLKYNWGHKYHWDKNTLSDDFDKIHEDAFDIHTLTEQQKNSFKKWWTTNN